MSLARVVSRRFLSTARPPPPPPAPAEESALSRRFTALAEAALTASPRRAGAIAAANRLPAPPLLPSSPSPSTSTPADDASSERAETRRLLRDRFLPGARAAVSFEALASLADAKIDAARQRGEFANLAGRGKPQPTRGPDSPFVDTTEHVLNRILQQQAAVPEWIEKQRSLRAAARGFRGGLRREWMRHAARCIASAGEGLERQCAAAERYARAEDRMQLDGVFRDPAWEAVERPYHALAVEELNSRTRAYNLLAPEPARKPYFSLERELQSCFRECAPRIAAEIRERAERAGGKSDAGGSGRGAETPQTPQTQDSVKPHYGFRQFWTDLWGKK